MRKLHTFKGGIHPKEMKELSNKCPITPAFPASKMVTIPVTMGGAPNSSVVAFFFFPPIQFVDSA